MQKNKLWLILGSIAGVLLILAICIITTYTSTRNEGNTAELGLTRQWKDMQARYGQSRLTVTDQLGIANEKASAARSILAAAVGGRYDKKGEPGKVDQQAVFSAIKEAYPDLSFLNVFDDVMVSIQAGRERFANDQTTMQDKIRSYDTWRTTGSFYHPTVVKWCGFPSKLLKANVGNSELTGAEALEKMSIAIADADTRQIFESGVDKPITQ